MNQNDAKTILAYNFFRFDTFFNWFLGILFLFFYIPVENLMSKGPLLPDFAWLTMGAAFLLFGIWQTYILIRRRFTRNVRLFSCITAWGPVMLLTYALVFMDFDLYIMARIMIWAGNIYMFVLGTLYFRSYMTPSREKSTK